MFNDLVGLEFGNSIFLFGKELVELFDYIADIDRSVHVVGFIDLVVSHFLARFLVAFLFLGKCQIRLAFRILEDLHSSRYARYRGERAQRCEAVGQ